MLILYYHCGRLKSGKNWWKHASVSLSKHDWQADATKHNDIKEKSIIEFNFSCTVETGEYFPIRSKLLNLCLIFEWLKIKISDVRQSIQWSGMYGFNQSVLNHVAIDYFSLNIFWNPSSAVLTIFKLKMSNKKCDFCLGCLVSCLNAFFNSTGAKVPTEKKLIA